MKNNKGYYSWIHSLNEAALNSHQRGQRMINEAKEVSKGKKKQLNESREDDKWEGPNLPREEFANLAKQIADLLKQDGGITPESIERAGGDPAEYARIRDLKVNDANNDGIKDASDVVAANNLDAADGVQDTKVKVGPRFTNPLAAQARLEMGHGVEGDEELAAKLNAKLDEPEPDMEDEDYWRRTMSPDENDVIGESLNQKISRILREEEEPVRKQSGRPAPRGRVVKGSDVRPTYAGSPRSQNAPEGMFKGTESAEQRLGKILAVVRDGPKKHGNAAYSWASNALETMQKTLRKD